MRHSRMGNIVAAAAAMMMPGLTIAAPVRPSISRQALRQQEASSRLPESRLNRSRHWDHARTYKEARFISPYPHRPVR